MRRYDRHLEWWERKHPTLLIEAVRRIGGTVNLSDRPRVAEVFDKDGTLMLTASFRQGPQSDFVRAIDPERVRLVGKSELVTPRQALDLLINNHIRTPSGVWS